MCYEIIVTYDVTGRKLHWYFDCEEQFNQCQIHHLMYQTLWTYYMRWVPPAERKAAIQRSGYANSSEEFNIWVARMVDESID